MTAAEMTGRMRHRVVTLYPYRARRASEIRTIIAAVRKLEAQGVER